MVDLLNNPDKIVTYRDIWSYLRKNKVFDKERSIYTAVNELRNEGTIITDKVDNKRIFAFKKINYEQIV